MSKSLHVMQSNKNKCLILNCQFYKTYKPIGEQDLSIINS